MRAFEYARVVAESVTWNGGSPPDIVWCFSGSAHPTLFIDTPVEQLQIMMDSNYFSCVYMAHAVLSAWLRSDARAKGTNPQTDRATSPPLPPRHLIFTGSFASFYSFAGFTPYSPQNGPSFRTTTTQASLARYGDTAFDWLILSVLAQYFKKL
ncbi:hypothetical protein DL771_003105 [Monosporascus sp. 5C6A]|nr:hypothetical protein DL771_003105 [Monosporascus sp. 5C6A]